MSDQRNYWADYYEKLAESPKPWLDYSNERVQAQSLALALEAGGPALGKACLDFGCGNGQLSLCLKDLGAATVTGIDCVEGIIDANRARWPAVTWMLGAADDAHLKESFDLIFFVEVLQYLPLAVTLERHWTALRPGGRITAIVPNRDCPIVAKAVSRFAGHYAPPTFNEIKSVLSRLAGATHWAIRGLTFQQNQAVSPYEVSPWARDAWTAAPPNRWQCVVVMS